MAGWHWQIIVIAFHIALVTAHRPHHSGGAPGEDLTIKMVYFASYFNLKLGLFVNIFDSSNRSVRPFGQLLSF